MNKAAKLVSESIIGESFVTITAGKNVLTIYPPTIKVICRACAWLSRIELQDNYTEISIIGEIPRNSSHMINAISIMIAGDKKYWRWESFKIRRILQSATNKELLEAWVSISKILGGEDFFACALSMKSAAQIVAK